MLDSASRLFTKVGFALCTVEAVAEDAGCATTTVYSAFKSKAGLLAAVLERDAFGAPYRESLEAIPRTPGAADRLRLVAHIARLVYEAQANLFALSRGAELVLPELAGQVRALERRRMERQRPIVESLARDKALRPGVSVRQARQRMWALTGRELYRDLVVTTGWPAGRYERWLGDLLVADLLEDAALK